METFRDMIIQYRDVQNVLIFLAAVGALAILFIIVKIIWMICSGSLKLEATLTDKRQDKKIKEQEREIERLTTEIEKMQGFAKEMDEIREKIKR
jgi:hypothetical protein